MFSAHRFTVSLAACVIIPSAALAQDDQQAPQPQTIIAFEHASFDEILTHPKDAGLLRAFSMIPARIREMPEEIPDLAQAPAGVFDLVDIAFEGPYRFVVVSLGSDPQTGLPRASAELAIGSNTRAGAEAAFAALNGLIPDTPQIERTDDGRMLVQTPAGAISISAYQGAGGQWWFGARLGEQDAVADALAALPDAPDGRTLMRGSLDLKSIIMPLKMMGAMMAGGNPEAAAGMSMIDSMGVLDALGLPVDGVVWSNDAGIHSRAVVHDARAALTKMGFATEALTAEHLGAIPADAVAAVIGRSDPQKMIDMIDMIRSVGPEAQQMLDAFADATGVDLENDILRSLDGTSAFYASDSTGGSGLMSWVVLTGVQNHDAMRGALEKLTNVANGMAQGIPYGDSNGKYLRIAHWKQGGIDFLTFETPGIPVPFSPTIALTDRWLIAGVSRQSALAAAVQAVGQGDRGLLSSAAFRQQWSEGLDGVIQLQYLDTQRAIKKGYGITTLLGGMLANGVRSPLGADREPGIVVPLYNDLVDGSRAMIKVTRWEGDDLAMLMHSDGSALVNIAGVAGAYGEPVMMLVVPAMIGAGIAESASEGGLNFGDDPPF